MRVLHLYRPTLPSLRAQAIQVLHAAHALASRGHEVTVLANAAGAADAADALAAFALPPLPTLHLHLSPSRHPGLAGLWFRARLMAWWAGAPGVVLARDKRRLAAALRLAGPARRRHRVVLESHELDSALALEAGQDPVPLARLEAALAAECFALVCNCEGTLAAWEQAHGEALPARRAALHNATSASRLRQAAPRQPPVVRVTGSLRAYKGPDLLVQAARLLPCSLEWLGGSEAERAALGAVPPNLRLAPPVPYPAVPDLLADSAALVLPLADNLFGRQLTSPLKLWDYLASSAPIAAPDLPSVRAVAAKAGAALHLHRPDDPADLARAVREALAAGPRAPSLRTWDQRAAEWEALLA